MDTQDLRELMLEAIDEPVGLEVKTEQLAKFKQTFYQIRSKNHIAFDCLSLVTPPEGGHNKLWIVKNEQPKESNDPTGKG